MAFGSFRELPMSVLGLVRKLCRAGGLSLALLVGATVAPAYAESIIATVDLSSQRMSVMVNGVKKYNWIVSTGKAGWRTPVGTYQPLTTYRQYYSQQFRMSLPYTVLISSKGYAIHGTSAIGRLGGPASHGCIRLHPKNAAIFYALVTSHGLWNTRVEVTP